ncbi:response regulator transcription factor [Thalassomonas sp. RHCl1]|uniref:response regulator transcription factor n=1 Tax=Thalassomonas sp. RHCl1 TaxID=2995320 RepID=UPI00248C163D|nr:response regulator transcription factor [Thalassomonas sp. RHCl1]
MQKIMLVEDNREISGPLINLLTVKGFMTSLCECGDLAVGEVKQFQPDLLLLDVKLPGLDGFEICQKVRQFSQIPVIFMSAVVSTEMHIKAFKLGADDFLDKPFCMSELLLRINAVLKRSMD